MRNFNGYFSNNRKRKPVDVRIATECACKAGLLLRGFKSNENIEH